jgi:hypothetical protein
MKFYVILLGAKLLPDAENRWGKQQIRSGGWFRSQVTATNRFAGDTL